MVSALQIDENHLRRLKRPELQKLAKEYKIKANLKSEVIIDLLLHRLAGATKHQAGSPSSIVRHADSIPDGDSSRHRPRERLIAIQTNPNPGRSLETPGDVPLLKQQPKGSVCQPARGRGLSYPGSPPDIENFDKEQLAAPESLVRETVAMLAELDKGDRPLMDQIINMRREISKLRSQTRNTRALLRSENARRRRAVQYYLYWHPITSNWSYEEVWSGKVKVCDTEDIVGFTTSDEEDLEEEKVGSNKSAPTNPQSPHLYGSIINNIDRTEENGASEAEVLLSPIGVPVTGLETFNTIMGEKRLRSRSPSDNGRHAPRRRTEQTLEGTLDGLNFISPPQTPLISTRIDKGKGKMTTEQVEKLEREKAVERFLAEAAAEAGHFPEVYDKTAKSNLEPTRERAVPEGHALCYDNSSCHSEDEAVVLDVPPTDSHKEGEVQIEFEVAEHPNNPLATQLANASTKVQAEAQTCIIKPGQDQEQENVKTGGDQKTLWPSTFSSASHQPRYTQRTSRKRKRAE